MQLLTAKEVCTICRIHRNTLYRWCKYNKFPKYINIGIGRKLLWLMSDIEQWVKDQK